MSGDDRLDRLLIEGYGRAYRTAYLIMRDPVSAEEAVQEAFLRVWRFRDALPAGDGVHPWIYRVLVNTCYSQLRRDIPRRQRSAGDEALGGRAGPDSTEAAATRLHRRPGHRGRRRQVRAYGSRHAEARAEAVVQLGREPAVRPGGGPPTDDRG